MSPSFSSCQDCGKSALPPASCPLLLASSARHPSSAEGIGLPIPADFEPTPDQSPRQRPAKRQRMSRDESSQVPLSALQRLSLSRKAGQNTPPRASPASASAAPTTTTVPATPDGKPLSKLALLAQKRKQAAAASPTPSSTGAGPSHTPSTPTRLVPTVASPSAPETPKPLSKLAQKMAAAKLAREQSAAAPTQELDAAMDSLTVASEVEDEATLKFFKNNDRRDRAKSPFFSILTARSRPEMDDIVVENIHLPPARDPTKLADRIRDAFAGAESPDDVVLRARQGRAGTAGLTTAGKGKA